MKKTTPFLSRIAVRAMPLDRSRGWLTAGALRFPCALGRGGISRKKREGDGATPAGVYSFEGLWYRAERGLRPCGALRKRVSRPQDGWCDDPASPRYNRPVTLPFAAGHEKIWREDALYDLVVEIGYNTRPAIRRRGSAIFLHVARPGFLPTEGCVALRKSDLRRLLGRISPKTRIVIA